MLAIWTTIAFVLLYLRRRTVLDLWLLVMCFAWLVEVTINAFLAARFNLGWYVSRLIDLASAGFFVSRVVRWTTRADPLRCPLWGQEQTPRCHQAMSALPPKADIDWHHLNVRFVSEGDICSAKRHVRFTPNSDRESGFSARGDVRFTPNSRHVQRTSRCLLSANSGHPIIHSITSSAVASSVVGTVMPRSLAVLRLIAISYLVGACTGRSPGFSPLRILVT